MSPQIRRPTQFGVHIQNTLHDSLPLYYQRKTSLLQVLEKDFRHLFR